MWFSLVFLWKLMNCLVLYCNFCTLTKNLEFDFFSDFSLLTSCAPPSPLLTKANWICLVLKIAAYFMHLLEKSLQCGKSAILLWKKFRIICSHGIPTLAHAIVRGAKKFVKALEEPRPKKNFKGEKDRLSQHRASIDPKMWKQPKIKGWSYYQHTFSIFPKSLYSIILFKFLSGLNSTHRGKMWSKSWKTFCPKSKKDFWPSFFAIFQLY